MLAVGTVTYIVYNVHIVNQIENGPDHSDEVACGEYGPIYVLEVFFTTLIPPYTHVLV